MSTPTATAANILRPTISSFFSFLLTPSEFSSRGTASSRVLRQQQHLFLWIKIGAKANKQVVGSTKSNVLHFPKFFDDDCQLWFSTIELMVLLQDVTQQNNKLKVFLTLYTFCSCRQSTLLWLCQVLNHMAQ